MVLNKIDDLILKDINFSYNKKNSSQNILKKQAVNAPKCFY